MKNKTLFIFTIIVLILLAGNVFLGIKYYYSQKEVIQAKADLEIQKTNIKILSFAKLFTDKVLKANQEIDFETRLSLENSVRNLQDSDVFSQWQKFTGAKTESDAQIEVKNLLEMLLNKIEIR